MKTITRKNVSQRITQFNAEHLTTARANIKNDGWQNIKIENGFHQESINEIIALIGGRNKTQKIMKLKLENEPFHHWSATRFIYDYNNQQWKYVAGQDYNSEMKEIRKYFAK